METCRLLHRIGEIKGAYRSDMIDVPISDVVPGHARQKLPLDVTHQLDARAAHQIHSGQVLPSPAPLESLPEPRAQPALENELRVASSPLLINTPSLGTRLLGLEVSQYLLAVDLIKSSTRSIPTFGVGASPRRCGRYLFGSILLIRTARMYPTLLLFQRICLQAVVPLTPQPKP